MTATILAFEQQVNAPAAEVYRAFTRTAPLRDWLCDVATADARIGGRLYVWWNSGYYAAGEYLALEPHQRVAFSWQGKGEPAPTLVEVDLAPAGEGVAVTLTHGGLDAGKAWEHPRAEFTRGWKAALENLASLAETGLDLRYTRRPMLGIYVEEYNGEIAARLGVPVTEGIRVAGVVDGLGAAAAGLQQDDVITGMAGHATVNWPALVTALQGQHAGDTVEVVFYRGCDLRRTEMTLSARQLPEVPRAPAALADTLRGINGRVRAALSARVAGVTDEAAHRRPGPADWSAAETIAHLIADEREIHSWITDLINDDERWSDRLENSTNVPARIAALLASYPTLADLVQEIQRSLGVTEAMIDALPDEFVAHRGSYWRLGHYLLQNEQHWDEHLAQIEAALAAA